MNNHLDPAAHRGLACQAANAFRERGRLRGLEVDDLIQEAFLALVVEGPRHDPARGAASTFARLVTRRRLVGLMRRPLLPTVSWEDLPGLEPEFRPAERPTSPPDVAGLLSCLSAIERACIILYFGLGGREPLYLAEVGRAFGVSAERVRQRLARKVGLGQPG
jgi:RNA polymerase sigma factor (sigma-70 family)